MAAATSVLLALLLAWMLAKIFWLLMAADADRFVADSPARPAAPAPPSARVDLGRYHLFGTYREDAAVAAFRDAPETSLNLALRGIVSSSDPGSGFAIIVAGGRQALYGIDAEVPGGATVKGVYPDRVVLLHDGRHETLRLPVDHDGMPEAQGGAGTRSPSSNAAESLSGWKEKLLLNLDSAARYSLIPVRGGGYRLFLSRDAEQMVHLGLRNGDVIKSANGITLNSQADVEQVIAKVLAGETLTLLIERGGAEMTLTPDIEQFVSGVR